ncbi:uncharacterized protein PGTG_19920 [Puccinia graminis f. sp. tritici CRL 75-36-700-3]|uniref:Uncharacterized protein n=1 Tax=Puccinia graminis f. sp. tritici (strain CRL 75-36-700-3 / race SCCL) TaxID=418459 RepID=E3LBF6_PUCGT|nr:uncharacterized protein PGTG_19920 [Puccinia graminis f. sp. tritici CRL 75-36-700-3]EFP93881.1 hypothetical protein PGTG_19920 [Puccinia graminis f. sp. tritici CRL 75-36-700-3]
MSGAGCAQHPQALLAPFSSSASYCKVENRLPPQVDIPVSSPNSSFLQDCLESICHNKPPGAETATKCCRSQTDSKTTQMMKPAATVLGEEATPNLPPRM